MITISQSPVLQALGYAIINSLWQFALLWLIFLFINTFFKITSHNRYISALLLQVTGFGWFMVTAFYYYGECLTNADTVFNLHQGFSYLASSGSSLSMKETFFSFILRAELFLPYLSLAYLILITCFTIKVIKAYRNTQHLRYNGLEKINVEWRLFVRKLSGQLGIKQTVGIYISNLIQSPVTIGYLKPVILLPLAVVNHLSPDQIEAILIHEMAHIKRNDYLVNILISIVEVALFFNPFMQLLSKQMKRERENSCDDWVLQYEYNACSYAKALVTIATQKSSDATNFAINAVDNRRALLIRVKRMIEKKEVNNFYRQQLISLLFITAAISSLAWFAPGKYPSNNKVVITPNTKYIAEPLVAKVDNPLFNPIFFLAKEDEKEEKTAMLKAAIEINTAPGSISESPVIRDVEMEIVEQFTPTNIKAAPQAPKDIQAVNVVLDSAIFKNYATRSLVVAEIKKLKKEFETLNRSSLFQNIDWKQFWDNTKVQKQLETAFEQLKALEMQNKKNDLVVSAVNRTVENCDQVVQDEHAQLRMLTNKKLEAIVKDRINDIKLQQLSNKRAEELNFNFDLPDFSHLNMKKENGQWSYTYSQKPRVVEKPCITVLVQTKAGSRKVKEKKTIIPENNELLILEAEVHEEKTRRAPVTRTLKIVRI